MNINDNDFNKEEQNKLENYQKRELIVNFIYILCVLTWLLYIIFASQLKLILTIAIGAIIVIATIFKKNSKKEIEGITKEKTLLKVLKETYSKVLYDKNGYINSSVYQNSQISLPFSNYFGSDFILIPKDNYSVEICKLVTKNKSNGVELSTNFNGIFGRVVLPHRCPYELALITNKVVFDNNFFKIEKNTNLVKDEICELDNIYDIYFTNSDAKSFFTPDTINLILQINKRLNSKICLSIANDILYFRIDNVDFMNIKFNGLNIDYNSIDKNITITDLIIDFAKLVIDVTNE